MVGARDTRPKSERNPARHKKIPDWNLGSLLKSSQVLPARFLAVVGMSVQTYFTARL